MTEHVKALYDFQMDSIKQPKPMLDEGQIEDMEQMIIQSLTENTQLEITIWKDGFFTSITGAVTKVDRFEKKLILETNTKDIFRINFFDITNCRTQ